MDLPKTFLTAFSCPNGPAENIFEGFFAELAILNVSCVKGTTITACGQKKRENEIHDWSEYFSNGVLL